MYAAQVIPPIDAEIAEKGHLWTETSEVSYQSPLSGLDVEFIEKVVKHLYNPVALRPSSVSDTAAANPLPGAHQQFTGQRSLLQFDRKIKRLAIAVRRLHVGKMFRIKRHPIDTSQVRRTETLVQRGFEFFVIGRPQLIYKVLFHNCKI